jgi:rifampicin phosphotransferase
MSLLPDLVELDHIRQTDTQRWGRKAAALGELRARGFPIPEGVCVSIQAFHQAAPDHKASPVLESALRAATDHLWRTSRYLAVRSSAAAEDLPEASLAGLYDSIIGVAEPAGIRAAVEAVWRSHARPAGIAAAAPPDAPGGMGVLIQPVIDAEVAGACFSADPVQPSSGRMVINAAWGLGAGVVDGSVPADTLWLRRRDLTVVERRIVEKDACFTLDARGGLVRSPVTGPRQRAECLPDEWAQRIAQFALTIEDLFGHAQDVEWAIADGQVWILQSRPIASVDDHRTLGRMPFPVQWEQPQDGRRFWTREHFERQGSAPLLPLDVEYVRLLESTRVETCLFMGADRNRDMRVLNGWVYSSPAPLPASIADLRVRQQALQDLELRLAGEGRTAWDHWGPEIERANERLSAVDPGHLDGPGLADFLQAAMAVRSRHNMLHPMMWFKPGRPYLDAFQRLSGLAGPEAESAAYRLLEGEESPLTRLVDGLYRLAQPARDLPEVARWMRAVASSKGAELADIFDGYPLGAEGAAGWLAEFTAFLAEFGDRNGGGWGSEALITTPSWRDQPAEVVRLAVPFLDANVESPAIQRERSRRTVDAEVDALCAGYPDERIVEDFRRQLRLARRVQSVVEIHNHHIEQIGLGQLRRAVRAAAAWLQDGGGLTAADDVFWLTFSEILAGLRDPGDGVPAEAIKSRKQDYHRWIQLEAPPFLGLPPAALSPRPPYTDAVNTSAQKTAGRIQGIGASAGVASGRARVIETWQTAPEILSGDILVAENAGPLWIPFFPILAGIVLEGGSLGQHAASTAREYGLPAVISAPYALQEIKDGDWITIDGTTGIVTLGRS